uniref:Uncharacterized protein n=1 Tax=mine drainage metagenome TaxID=410659 RepID=E6QTV1_9ZZZZ
MLVKGQEMDSQHSGVVFVGHTFAGLGGNNASASRNFVTNFAIGGVSLLCREIGLAKHA